MVSRTKMLTLIKTFAWQEVQQGLDENPDLLAYRDDKGRSLLHLTCAVDLRRYPELNAEDSVKQAAVLIEHGLDHSEPAFSVNDWLATPLWHAVSRGENLVLAAYLLEQGCDPNHCLWAAIFNNDTDAIRLVIHHGADVDPVYEEDGTTPFLTAVKSGRFEAAKVLLELGANVDYQDPKQRTPLHWALRNGAEIDMIQLLLDQGARGDIEDEDGRTSSATLQRKKDPVFRKLADQYFGKG